jgi:hypothetical protein
MTGKRFLISGMRIEILSDQDDKWQTRNLTTGEILLFDKVVLDRAIRLGKAEDISLQSEDE